MYQPILEISSNGSAKTHYNELMGLYQLELGHFENNENVWRKKNYSGMYLMGLYLFMNKIEQWCVARKQIIQNLEDVSCILRSIAAKSSPPYNLERKWQYEYQGWSYDLTLKVYSQGKFP